MIYPLGLALLPLSQFFWQWFSARWSSELRLTPAAAGSSGLQIFTWIGGFVAFGVTALFYWINYRLHPRPPRWLSYLARQVLSMQWVYQTIEIAFRFSVQLVGLITGLLEGDGGILWVLVLLTLLVVVLLGGGQLG